MKTRLAVDQIRKTTVHEPLRILMSACLAGVACGFDSTTYGKHPGAIQLLKYKTARVIRFCPEDYSFGTPREMCDIHGGNGLDVLQRNARVLTVSGEDWTAGMIRASERMLEVAREEEVEIAVMMDISAACGSQVIYNGNRFEEDTPYQIGAGVCAAQLIRHGIPVISQRDFASLEILYSKLDPNHKVDQDAVDHHETDWYQEYFNNAG